MEICTIVKNSKKHGGSEQYISNIKRDGIETGITIGIVIGAVITSIAPVLAKKVKSHRTKVKEKAKKSETEIIANYQETDPDENTVEVQ